MNFTIGKRIGAGFAILIILTSVVFTLTNYTLNESKEINDAITTIYNPSITALEDLNIVIVRSKMLINNWVFIQSGEDNIYKTQLRNLIGEEYPAKKKRTLELSENWPEHQKLLIDTITNRIEELFSLHEEIMMQLNSFESYEDAMVVFMINPMIEENGEVDVATNEILSKLQFLISRQKEESTMFTTQMVESFSLLQLVVRGSGILLAIGGIIIALITTRSIVNPVNQLKTILLKLGKGLFPQEKITKRSDEIGEMSEALEDLVAGLKRTTQFSNQVGAGDFEAEFEPLSREDVLGHALLKMRNNLKDLTFKLEQDKFKVKQHSIELRQKNDELAKLSIVASETDNAVVIATPEGQLEWVNAAFERMSGFTLDEFIEEKGNNIIDTSSTDNIEALIKESIETKKSVVFESLNSAKNGRQFWVSSTLTPIFDDTNNIKKLVIIEADITERKTAEELIQRKNKAIKDSIVYAKRIQEAILPTKEFIKEALPDSFILFKPRDIVSGDFYWYSSLKGKSIIAAVDCTGHGVPGAFMSMIGNSLLNEIVYEKGLLKPSAILDNMKTGIIKSLKQKGERGESRDGMDIAICAFDHKTGMLEYAGAYNPLYIIRAIDPANKKPFKRTASSKVMEPAKIEMDPEATNEEFNLYEIKADKQPIGIHYRKSIEPFTNHKVQLVKGDAFYIFSDGYPDQFGGKLNKRFITKRFKKLLLSIQQNSMEEQGKILEKHHLEWKGGFEQNDDIVVIGVKY